MINSLAQIGLVGLQRSRAGMRQAANEIAAAGAPHQADVGEPADVTGSVVHLTEQRLQAQASVEVISVSDEMLGRLLDVLT